MLTLLQRMPASRPLYALERRVLRGRLRHVIVDEALHTSPQRRALQAPKMLTRRQAMPAIAAVTQ